MIDTHEIRSATYRLLSILTLNVLGVIAAHADAPPSPEPVPFGDPMVKPVAGYRSYFGAVPVSDERILIVGGWGSGWGLRRVLVVIRRATSFFIISKRQEQRFPSQSHTR